MTEQQHLELDGHQLVPETVRDGSVLMWQCTNCGHQADDAYDYVAVECQTA